MDKISNYEEKNAQLDLQRTKNRLEQEGRRQGIQNGREKWIIGNHSLK